MKPAAAGRALRPRPCLQPRSLPPGARPGPALRRIRRARITAARGPPARLRAGSGSRRRPVGFRDGSAGGGRFSGGRCAERGASHARAGCRTICPKWQSGLRGGSLRAGNDSDERPRGRRRATRPAGNRAERGAGPGSLRGPTGSAGRRGVASAQARRAIGRSGTENPPPPRVAMNLGDSPANLLNQPRCEWPHHKGAACGAVEPTSEPTAACRRNRRRLARGGSESERVCM